MHSYNKGQHSDWITEIIKTESPADLHRLQSGSSRVSTRSAGYRPPN